MKGLYLCQQKRDWDCLHECAAMIVGGSVDGFIMIEMLMHAVSTALGQKTNNGICFIGTKLNKAVDI